MRNQMVSVALAIGLLTFAGCGGGGGGSGYAGTTPASTATNPPAAVPQVVHIAFAFGEKTDATYGPVYFYGLTPGTAAQVVHFYPGSQLVFKNDDTTAHTASGLGTGPFPASFTNPNRTTQSGTTIDGSNWSTGTLAPGATSSAFTVGPVGSYYFGCGFHYSTTPTATNNSMGDVIVSTTLPPPGSSGTPPPGGGGYGGY